MKTLPLGNNSVQISPEREAYTALRLKYQGLAESAKEDFANRFVERFKDMDQLHATCNRVAKQYLDDVIDKAIRDLVAFGVMDIDDEHFLTEHLLPRYSWEDAFAVIDDQYFEIVLKAAELDAYRTARRENRGGVMGGGFGVEGVVQGVAVATAANMAIGAVHGIVNLGEKVFSSIGDGQKKSKLYNDPRTRAYLAGSIFQLIFQVHYALVGIVNSRHPNRPLDNVSDEDAAKAKGLLENIGKGRITGDEADNCLIQALRLNPYDPALYFLWLDHHADVDGQLERMAQHFGVREITARKREMLQQHKDSLNFSTPEECNASLVRLEQYADSIGYQSFADERESILALADRLDRARRTVNGKLYETVESAEVARLQWEEEQTRTLNGKLYETPEAYEVAKRQWENQQSRTVNGVVYATTYEAQIERNKKDVDPLLGAIIFFFPLPSALLTRDPGYSAQARSLAYLWLFLYLGYFYTDVLMRSNDIGSAISGIVSITIASMILGGLALLVRKVLMHIYKAYQESFTPLNENERKEQIGKAMGESGSIEAGQDAVVQSTTARKWHDPDLSRTNPWGGGK